MNKIIESEISDLLALDVTTFGSYLREFLTRTNFSYDKVLCSIYADILESLEPSPKITHANIQRCMTWNMMDPNNNNLISRIIFDIDFELRDLLKSILTRALLYITERSDLNKEMAIVYLGRYLLLRYHDVVYKFEDFYNVVPKASKAVINECSVVIVKSRDLNKNHEYQLGECNTIILRGDL